MAQEAIARITRLRKQRRLLEKRVKEISRQGLRFLNKLDATKEKECLEKEKQEVVQQAVNTSVATNDSPLDSDLTVALLAYDPSDPFWATLDFGGRTPQVSRNTS